MNDKLMIKLIESIGDDAKVAFIVYTCLEYGTTLVFLGLVTWGIRSIWTEIKNSL